MKRKFLTLSTAFFLLTGIIAVPAYCFTAEFIMPQKIYSDLNFSKNTVFTPSAKINFGGFTQNIDCKTDKNIDSSSSFALLSSNNARSAFSSSNISGSGNTIDNFHSAAYGFPAFERLRRWSYRQTAPALFVFFILLYIGMLRSIFVFNSKTTIFYILKPLLVKTGVFHLGASR